MSRSVAYSLPQLLITPEFAASFGLPSVQSDVVFVLPTPMSDATRGDLNDLGEEVQDEMAAVADSSASGGTSPTKMVENLKKLTGRLKVHIRELQPWKYDEFQRMVADYNRSAKKNKKREVNLEGMRVIDIGEI